MISKTVSFKTTDGTIFTTIEEAKKHEIAKFLGTTPLLEGNSPMISDLSGLLIANSEKIIDLLTTKAGSKLAARRINGGTKKRTAKPDAANVNPLSPATK